MIDALTVAGDEGGIDPPTLPALATFSHRQYPDELEDDELVGVYAVWFPHFARSWEEWRDRQCGPWSVSAGNPDNE